MDKKFLSLGSMMRKISSPRSSNQVLMQDFHATFFVLSSFCNIRGISAQYFGLSTWTPWRTSRFCSPTSWDSPGCPAISPPTSWWDSSMIYSADSTGCALSVTARKSLPWGIVTTASQVGSRIRWNVVKNSFVSSDLWLAVQDVRSPARTMPVIASRWV